MDRNDIIYQLKTAVKTIVDNGGTIQDVRALRMVDFDFDADQRAWMIRHANGARNRTERYFVEEVENKIKDYIKSQLITLSQTLSDNQNITVKKARDLIASAVEILLEEYNG